MTDYCVVYQLADGKIVRTVTGQPFDFVSDSYTDALHSVTLSENRPDIFKDYILNGEVTERPASPVSRTDLTLLSVPTGSKLYINGESYDAAGTVELEFPLSGTYSLRVECFPFLDWTDVVTV
jgi:hypothetical protein